MARKRKSEGLNHEEMLSNLKKCVEKVEGLIKEKSDIEYLKLTSANCGVVEIKGMKLNLNNSILEVRQKEICAELKNIELELIDGNYKDVANWDTHKENEEEEDED